MMYIFAFLFKITYSHEIDDENVKREKKQEIADDRFASLEIQLLSIQQQGS